CRRGDAAETYLAYLAHFLWMDITLQVAWTLASIPTAELEDFLASASMFEPFVSTIPGDDSAARGFTYRYRMDHFGPAFPSNPYTAFQFITGDPEQREEGGPSFLDPGDGPSGQRFLAYNLLSWVLNHLRHNSLSLNYGFEHYGY